MTTRFDAHVRARARLITRIAERRSNWSVCRKGDDFHADAVVSLAAFVWDKGWGMVAAEPYSPFGGRQMHRLAKDVPTSVIHSIMCTRPR